MHDATTDAGETSERRPPRRVPLGPAVAMAVALVVLAVGVTSWWQERADTPGRVDVGFYDDMTTHHFQALEMAWTYLRNGDDADLHSRAVEIAFSQSGDIRVMQDALSRWGEEGDPESAMAWMGMPVAPTEQPGMATRSEMDALDRARGRELDDLFTTLMIRHHSGGAEMARYAADRARLGEVRELAGAMATVQRREIDELNHVRLRLGLAVVPAETGAHGH